MTVEEKPTIITAGKGLSKTVEEDAELARKATINYFSFDEIEDFEEGHDYFKSPVEYFEKDLIHKLCNTEDWEPVF